MSQVTIVFTDLKDFTAMSESLAPDELAAVLAGYFNKTDRAILAEHGTIIKYIGDAMNLASRLEGLNKHLGTDGLLSEATRKQLGEALLLRRTGRFILAGKEHPVEVHELLGLSDDSPNPPGWPNSPPVWRSSKRKRSISPRTTSAAPVENDPVEMDFRGST